jgi:hypothetical protein
MEELHVYKTHLHYFYKPIKVKNVIFIKPDVFTAHSEIRGLGP